MRKVSKRVLVTTLLILSILVLGVGAFIVLQIQNSQAPTDSSASGFGQDATRDLFDKVSAEFLTHDCSEFLPLDELNQFDESFAGIAYGSYIQAGYNEGDALSPLFCAYSLGESRQLSVELAAYLPTAEIDPSATVLQNRINGQLLSTILADGPTGVNGDMTYNYGVSKQDANDCVVTIFQNLNDFHFASMKFSGFVDCGSEQNIARAKAFTAVLTNHLSQIMTKIYIANRGSVPTSAPGL